MRQVIEADVLEFDMAAGASQRFWIFGCLNFQRSIEHFENPLGAREARLDAVGDVRNLAHLIGELLQEIDEHEQPGAKSQLPFHHQIAAVTEQDNHVDLSQKAHDRLENAEPPEDLFLLIHHRAVGGDKLFDLLLLPAKAFHHLHALNIFRERKY